MHVHCFVILSGHKSELATFINFHSKKYINIFLLSLSDDVKYRSSRDAINAVYKFSHGIKYSIVKVEHFATILI